ncbi:MAG: hypothetical protein ACI395_06370 [Candidatus Cryptobacteroides sp.]
MKRFIFATLAIAAMVACTREQLPSEEPGSEQTDYVPGGPVTFTASLPSDSKTFDSDGKVTWATTDYIFIGTDKADLVVTSPDGIVTVSGGAMVCLADATISADKKTATFTVTGLPEDAEKYYAVATERGDRFVILWKITTNGGVIPSSGRLKGMNGQTKHHLAVASCTPKNTAMTFSNAGCIVKFTNPESKIKKIELQGANGENIIGNFEINAETLAVSQRSDNAAAPISYNYTNSGENYIFLAPGLELTKGLLINAYSDNDGTKLFGTYNTKALTTTPGKMYDLGDLHKKIDYFDQYAGWEAGSNIVVGDKTYNKATFGGKAYHITSTSSASQASYDGAIFFVDPDQTINFTQLGGSKEDIEVVVVGNTRGTRSKITLSGDGSGTSNCMGYKVAMKNVEITYGDSGLKLFRTYGDRNMGYLVLDDCRLNYGCCFLQGQFVEDFQIVNSDICYDNSVQYNPTDKNDKVPMMVNPAEGTGTKIKLENNVFYSSSFKEMCIIGSSTLLNTSVTYSNVIISNNTFYNVALYDPNKAAFVNLADVTSSLSIKNNIVYAPSESQDRAMVFVNTPNSTGIKDRSSISGNKINVFIQTNGCPWGSFVIYSGGKIWILTDSALTEDPFTSFNTTTGEFVKSETYAGVGATR